MQVIPSVRSWSKSYNASSGMAELSDIPTINIPLNDDAPDIIKKIFWVDYLT